MAGICRFLRKNLQLENAQQKEDPLCAQRGRKGPIRI